MITEDIRIWTPNLQRNLYWILGTPFDAITLKSAVDVVRQSAAKGTKLFISTPNLNFLIAAQSDLAFASSVVHSDLSLPDGMPIVWLAQLFGMPIKERVAGSSLFEALNQPSASDAQEPLRVFFFGGPEGAGQAASDAMNAQIDGSMRCVGFLSPGFGTVADMSSHTIIDRINQSSADFLVVALGASKGQSWIEHNLPRLKPPVVSHLGAVINFTGGSIKRAPAWIQRLGLEWVWRVKEEPSLWIRYLNDGLAFFKLLTTKAIPLALLVRKMKAGGILDQPVKCFSKVGGETLEVKWSGPLTHAQAGPLYEQFTSAQRHGQQVSLDLSLCTYVDCDAIPHIAAFELSQRLALKKLHIFSVSTSVALIFKLSNVPFVFEAAEQK